MKPTFQSTAKKASQYPDQITPISPVYLIQTVDILRRNRHIFLARICASSLESWNEHKLHTNMLGCSFYQKDELSLVCNNRIIEFQNLIENPSLPKENSIVIFFCERNF